MATRLLVALALVASCAARADQPIRIGWLTATNDLALAKMHGSLDAAAVHSNASIQWIGPFPAARPALEALNAGAVDITVASSTAVVAALAAHVPLVVFAYQQMGPDGEAIVVKDTSPFHTIQDLAGHRVAANRGGTGEYLLSRAVSATGMAPDSIRRIYLNPPDAGPAFVSGSVDGWVVWDPFLTIALQSYGARVLANGSAMGSDNAVVMVASPEFAARWGNLLEMVFDVLMRENAWAVAHKTEAGEVWATVLKLPLSMAASFGERNASPLTAAGPSQMARIRSVADWYVTSGILQQRPDMTGIGIDLSR